MCQLPRGCILHEPTGACPLCDEDGADRIANWLFEESYKVIDNKILFDELIADFRL